MDPKDSESSSKENVHPVDTLNCIEEDAERLDVSRLDKHDTLFEHHITDNDDIWMVQTPAEIDADTMRDVFIDFDSPVSKLKCKVNKSKKRFNVYAIKNSSCRVNLLLPSKKSKSFRSRSYPLNGRIILQESVRFPRSKNVEPKELGETSKTDGGM